MDDVMKSILNTVADSYDEYRPGAGDCVRKLVNENQNPSVESGTASAEADAVTSLTGRELDFAIARRVMGWRSELRAWYAPNSNAAEARQVPSYSTEMDAAISVIVKMKQTHNIEIQGGKGSGGWRVCFEPEGFRCAASGGPSLPDVICRAALQAVKPRKER